MTKKIKTSSPKRLYWIDNAKALGIIAVFYGHIIEKVFLTSGSVAYLQFKLIYSFHMPLFFILAGYIAKQPGLDFHSFIKDKFLSRILPFVFFNILIIPIYLATDVMMQKQIEPQQLIFAAMQLIRGFPSFNFVTWFLVCLFTVEVLHFIVSSYLNGNKKKYVFFIILFYILGWVISREKSYVVNMLQFGEFWYVYEAFVAYSFYLVGKLIFVAKLDSKMTNKFVSILVLLISLILLVGTFDLNSGPFSNTPQQVVLVAAGIYGNPFFFPLTAIAGSIFIIIFSRMIGSISLFDFLGRNTLILMGLNGFYYHFINTCFINYSIKFISGSEFSIFLLCAVLTCISLILCVPFILLLERYLPQLTGNPKVAGPILPMLYK